MVAQLVKVLLQVVGEVGEVEGVLEVMLAVQEEF